MRASVVLHAGSNAGIVFNDTWEFRNSLWLQQFPRSIPEARQGAATFYDPESNATFIFGGLNSIVDYQDLWQWQWSESVDREQTCPASGTMNDDDGDHLASDVDPDCWWRQFNDDGRPRLCGA